MSTKIEKIRDRIVMKNLIKKYESQPDGLVRSILYRKRLAISQLIDIKKYNCINQEERDNLFNMILSPDIENLVVAESVIENFIQKLNDRT